MGAMDTLGVMPRGRSRTHRAGRARARVLALLLAWAAGGGVLAEPLRISLDGLADPGPVSAAASAAEAARFVSARPDPAASAAAAQGAAKADPDAADDERDFVPALALPRREPGPELALPRPDESQGVLRLLRGDDGSTAAAPPLPERRALGAFGRRDAGASEAAHESAEPGREGPAPAAAAAAEAAEDAFEALPDEAVALAGAGTSASAAAFGAAPEPREGPDHVRMLTVFIVVPLVLAAMLLLWRLDRGGRHRRRRGSSTRHARAHDR